jgi:hypothetical protein
MIIVLLDSKILQMKDCGQNKNGLISGIKQKAIA